MQFRSLVLLLKRTYSEWTEDKGPRLGAALAYYAIFSIPPLMMIVIAGIGLFYHGDVSGRIQAQLGSLIGSENAETILQSAQSPDIGHGSRTLAGLVGILVLLFGASGVFAELQNSLNTIWRVKPKEGRGFKDMIKDRFLSFAMVLGICFLLVVSLVVSAFVAAMTHTVSAVVPGGEAFGHVLELAASLLVITLLFAMIFKILPDVEIGWNDVWMGAAVTAVLFTVGKFAIGMYLGKSSIGSAYGAAGSVVILVTWIYYSAQILLFGAEFTRVWTVQYRPNVAPAQNAQPVSPAERAEQGLEPVTAIQAPRAAPAPQRESVPGWNYLLVVLTWLAGGLLLSRTPRD